MGGLKRQMASLVPALLLTVFLAACGGSGSDTAVPTTDVTAEGTHYGHSDDSLGAGDHSDDTPGMSATTVPPGPDGSRARESGDRSSLFLRATDQRSDGTSVVVEETVLTAPGWVVVHADSDAGLGPIIGVSALLPTGRSEGVRVTLDRPIVASVGAVHAMVHMDDGEAGKFEFPAGDQPATTGEGALVAVRIGLRIE